MRKLWQMSKVRMVEESIKSMKSHKQKGVTLDAYLCLQRGRGVEKLVIRYVSTKWMAPNKCCGIFFVPCSGQYTRASVPAREMSLFSSIIITNILFYAIIRIYKILHIYLQVSETEGLEEIRLMY